MPTVRIEKCKIGGYKIDYTSKPLTFVLFADKIEIKHLTISDFTEWEITIPSAGTLFVKKAVFVGFEPEIKEARI